MRDVRDNFVWQQRFEPVRRRFGFLGLFLYKHFSKRTQWQRIGYIRKLYTSAIYLLYGIPVVIGELIIYRLSGNFKIAWVLLIILSFGYIYGRWAEDYFEKFKKR